MEDEKAINKMINEYSALTHFGTKYGRADHRIVHNHHDDNTVCLVELRLQSEHVVDSN